MDVQDTKETHQERSIRVHDEFQGKVIKLEFNIEQRKDLRMDVQLDGIRFSKVPAIQEDSCWIYN